MDGIDLRKLYRLIALVTAIGLWAISVTFSVDGFSFLMDNQKFAAMGIFLSLAVTAIELIWSHDRNQSGLTIMMIGTLCYVYGVYTNIIGINQARGTEGFQVFSVLLGFFLEIAPEPIFVWAVYGPNKEGSFIDNLLGKGAGAMSVKAPQQHNQSNSRPQQQPARPQQQRPPFQMGKPGGGKPAGGPPSFGEMRERAQREIMGGNGSGRPQVEEED